MEKWNWSAIATIATIVIAFGVLWNAIVDLRTDVNASIADLRERMARVETIIDERLPKRQASMPDVVVPLGSPLISDVNGETP